MVSPAVAEVNTGVDLHLLIELYQRGESEFFSEVLRQFPALVEEILACREMVGQIAGRLSEHRQLEGAAFGKERVLYSLIDHKVRLDKKVQKLEAKLSPLTAAEAAEAGAKFVTPFQKQMAKRQAELMAAKKR